MSKITVLNREVTLTTVKDEDYICLTDIAKHRNADDPRFIIQNWMRTRSTVEFLGIWECLNNSGFNRVDFEAVKNEAGSNAFVMTPSKCVHLTGAIGIRQMTLLAGDKRLAVQIAGSERLGMGVKL